MQDLDPSDICKKKNLNPLKRIRVIIRTPTHGRTDGRTDEQGESSIPPLNFVSGGIKMRMCHVVDAYRSSLLSSFIGPFRRVTNEIRFISIGVKIWARPNIKLSYQYSVFSYKTCLNTKQVLYHDRFCSLTVVIECFFRVKSFQLAPEI